MLSVINPISAPKSYDFSLLVLSYWLLEDLIWEGQALVSTDLGLYVPGSHALVIHTTELGLDTVIWAENGEGIFYYEVRFIFWCFWDSKSG